MIGNLCTYWIVFASIWYTAANPLFFPEQHGIQGDILKRQNNSRQLDSLLDGSVPVRRNILEFQNDRVTWSLYIQALTNLQRQSDQNNLFSYFQLSGIHGRPYAQWGDSPKNPASPVTGYCTHNSVLFLPWHRPYLASFEQALIAEAQNIAKTYTNRPEYSNAANNLRIPFWDWAAVPMLPDAVTQQQVQIETSTGSKTVDNPLYQFNFPRPLDPRLFPSDSSDGWFAQFSQTVRGANSKSPNQASDTRSVNSQLQNSKLMSDTWRALMKSTDFNSFGSTATPGTSLENIHNSLHSYVGSRYGHMSYLSYAAYDPVFWLHHANVDRLFALWQVLHPDSYVESQPEEFGNFVIPADTVVDANTPLQPFRNQGTNQWWTPSSARDLTSFSYTYPELQGNQTPDQLKSNVTAVINRLYNPGSANSRGSAKVSLEGASTGPRSTREWSASIRVSKFDVRGERFKILIFINGVPESSDDWDMSKTLAGSVAIFPPPHPSGSLLTAKLTSYSEVDLGQSLEENNVDVDDVPTVIEYLRTRMQWRIQNMDGSVVPTQQVPSLLVTVQDEIVNMPSDITQLPTYGKKTIHPEALNLSNRN